MANGRDSRDRHRFPKVQILLATHNGAHYLPDQLDSLARQERADVDLVWIDDMSSDSTVEVMNSHANRLPTRRIVSSHRLGVPGAFLGLLAAADSGRDLYAYCDQDDVWDPAKIDAAWKEIRQFPADVPVLWICGARIVVNDGANIPEILTPPNEVVLSQALVEGLSPGCAMVWNGALMRLMAIPRADECRMHDSWTLLTALLVGNVITHPEPLMSYRIHGANAIGIDQSLPSRWRRRRRQSRLRLVSWSQQAHGLLRYYGPLLRPDTLARLDVLARGPRLRRTAAVLVGNLQRRSRKETLALAVVVLLHGDC